MKTYIAFSGGVESTTMCLLYGKGATAVFTDTGSEHAYLYERLDKVEKFLKEFHEGDFELIRLRANVKIKGETVNTLTEAIIAKKFFPSAYNRFCTIDFKIKPLDDFLKTQGDVCLFIGLNADEEDRVGNHGLVDNVTYKYPLKDQGITRQMCVDILTTAGIAPDFPAYMRRGGCIFCPFKSKKEFKAMVHLSPNEIDIVRQIEEAVQDYRGKYFRIRDNMPSMAEFIQNEKNNLFGDLSSFYDDSEENYSCGVFCHR